MNAVKKELVELEEAESCEEPTKATLEPPCKRSVLSRILGDSPEELLIQRSMFERVNQEEIDGYLQMPVVDVDQSPLELWRREQTQFPMLSKLARKYSICVCATSVASERVFSAANYIASNLRSCLKPTKINQLTFLQRNLNQLFRHF